MRVPEMFSDHRMFTLLNALMEVAASVPNIICAITYHIGYTNNLIKNFEVIKS